ncbi:unnamed protein product, partial [Prorocentrum cordatum]
EDIAPSPWRMRQRGFAAAHRALGPATAGEQRPDTPDGTAPAVSPSGLLERRGRGRAGLWARRGSVHPRPEHSKKVAPPAGGGKRRLKEAGGDRRETKEEGGHGKRRPDRERERRTQRCRQGAPLCRQQAQTSEDPTRPGQHLHRAAAQRPGDPHPAPSTPSTARSPRRRALEPLEVWENEAPLRHWG